MKAINKILKRLIQNFILRDLHRRQIVALMLLGKQHALRVKALRNIKSIHEAEFKVFSQWGEDGIIQYLINNVEIESKTFVEFGVETYEESNTRFLLMQDNWKGLVIDGSAESIKRCKSDYIYWRHDLTAVEAFITKDNINTIIKENLGEGDIGILSVDVDGNDYWIWEAITVINPRIVICEYNSVFGCEHAVTIPYNEGFNQTQAHYSTLFWGASLGAFCHLAEEKGYDFVGSNSVGCNAFFVRKDLSGNLKVYSAKEGYVESKYRESRDIHGNLTFISGKERLKVIADEEVFDIGAGRLRMIKEIYR